MYPPTEDDLDYYFSFNLKFLSVLGFKISLEKNQPRLTLVDKLPSFIIVMQGIMISVFENNFVTDAWSSDKSLAMQIFSQVVTNIQCVSKGLFVAFAVDRIQNVLQEMQILWIAHRPSQYNRETILREAHRTLLFCKIYTVIVFICLSSYFIGYVPIFVNLAKQYRNRESNNHTYDLSQTLLLLKYPFEITNMSTYVLIIFQESFYILYACSSMWINSDTLFAQTITHICIQFKILKYDIDVKLNHENGRDQLSLVTFVRRHRDLLRICTLVEEVFSPIIFIIMLLSSLNMCVNVAGTQETIHDGKYDAALLNMAIFSCVCGQVLFYCTFAEQITNETRSLADTLYNCSWTEKDYKLRFYVQLIIMRCQKPFYCTAYGLYPIGYAQLASILNAAFSYYMLLQTIN